MALNLKCAYQNLQMFKYASRLLLRVSSELSSTTTFSESVQYLASFVINNKAMEI